MSSEAAAYMIPVDHAPLGWVARKQPFTSPRCGTTAIGAKMRSKRLMTNI